MPIKISAALLALILLAGAIIGAVTLARAVTTERDGWDIVARVDVTTDPILIEPADLIRESDRDTLVKVVNESRDYGIPFTVHVITDRGLDDERSADEVAADRYADAPVETSEGADDGLLMVVIVTQPDHTETRVGFATGNAFYPRGGITPERLDYIADVQMQAMIDENRIGAAVVEGATWVEWTQLFQPTPNEPPTVLEKGLDKLLVPWGTLIFAGLAALVLAAAATTLALTKRGTTNTVTFDEGEAIDMGAISRGRVDRAVLAGSVLDAVDRGTITLDSQQRLSAGPSPATSRDTLLIDAIREIATRGGTPTPAALGRFLATDGTVRHALENRLADAGALDRRSPVMTIWLRGIAIVGSVLGVIGLVLSVFGEAAPSLAAALALTVFSLIALIWNEQRSWATRAGQSALREWLAAHPSSEDRERALYDAIIGMDLIDLEPPGRSTLRPDGQALATSLAR